MVLFKVSDTSSICRAQTENEQTPAQFCFCLLLLLTSY